MISSITRQNNPLSLQGFFMKKLLVIVAACVVAVGSSQAGYKPVGSYEAANTITPEQLKDYLTFIASDELEGRDTPSRGLNIAALFIATKLSRWGLKPAGGDGTYFQEMLLRRTKIDQARTKVAVGDETFEFGKDFLARPSAAKVSGRVVYVGFGYFHKEKNINFFGDVDVEGKIVVYSSGYPIGLSRRDMVGTQGEDWDNAAGYARKHGAKALIMIPGYRQLVAWERSARTNTERGTLTVDRLEEKKEADDDDNSPLPVITASAQLVSALFNDEKETAADVFNSSFTGIAPASFALSDDRVVTVEIGTAIAHEKTQNVVGILEGSDSQLKDEYVAIGAHYDHVGTGAPIGGDSIYNGADDDGSGTVAMIAIAEALSKGPRLSRSMLFVWHAGEEKGLLGSKYFTEFPTVPLKSVVTQLNIDMIGRSKTAEDTNPADKDLSTPDEVYVIGSHAMSTTLGELSEEVNKSYNQLKLNYRYDDPTDPNRFFFRSDHYNYAQKGVPIAFFFDGVHQDYHKVSDSVEKIDFEKMSKVARTICATAIELATMPQRPAIDKALPTEWKRGR